jgi:hypothetical protein
MKKTGYLWMIPSYDPPTKIEKSAEETFFSQQLDRMGAAHANPAIHDCVVCRINFMHSRRDFGKGNEPGVGQS